MMSETSTQPTSTAVQTAEERLQLLLPGIYRGRTDEVQPVSMGSAPLAFDVEGNVAWDRMWGSFCDLAMAGGPPHKGKLLEPGTPELIIAEPVRYAEVCNEITRGIELAARLRVEPSTLPGWLRVSCTSDAMAGWLLRAITMENVSVCLDGDSILLPAGPAFRVEKEIKNVITVTVKTAHYWSGHLIRLQKLGIGNLFYQLDSEAPLLQPAWHVALESTDVRGRIERTLEDATGLRTTEHRYANWIGLECGSVPSAITTMRRLVASNILCRREETAIFLPLTADPERDSERIGRSVAELLERTA
jgi:sirohydrochlorin cobaltochelatase